MEAKGECASGFEAVQQTFEGSQKPGAGPGGPVSFAAPHCDVNFDFVTTTMGSHVLMDPRAKILAELVYGAR